MTLPELRALTEYWKEAPPIHESFASFCRGLGGHSTHPGVPGPLGVSSSSPDVPADNNPAFAHLLQSAGVALPPGFFAAPAHHSSDGATPP